MAENNPNGKPVVILAGPRVIVDPLGLKLADTRAVRIRTMEQIMKRAFLPSGPIFNNAVRLENSEQGGAVKYVLILDFPKTAFMPSTPTMNIETLEVSGNPLLPRDSNAAMLFFNYYTMVAGYNEPPATKTMVAPLHQLIASMEKSWNGENFSEDVKSLWPAISGAFERYLKGMAIENLGFEILNVLVMEIQIRNSLNQSGKGVLSDLDQVRLIDFVNDNSEPIESSMYLDISADPNWREICALEDYKAVSLANGKIPSFKISLSHDFMKTELANALADSIVEWLVPSIQKSAESD